jgi:hypothetical protein
MRCWRISCLFNNCSLISWIMVRILRSNNSRSLPFIRRKWLIHRQTLYRFRATILRTANSRLKCPPTSAESSSTREMTLSLSRKAWGVFKKTTGRARRESPIKHSRRLASRWWDPSLTRGTKLRWHSSRESQRRGRWLMRSLSLKWIISLLMGGRVDMMSICTCRLPMTYSHSLLTTTKKRSSAILMMMTWSWWMKISCLMRETK